VDDREFESRQGLGIFLFITESRRALEPTQTSIQWVPGALSLGVKRTWREADYSPPYSAEVKNAWRYVTNPQHDFMAWCLVKSLEKSLPLPSLRQKLMSVYHMMSVVRIALL
jgi:hypothetical protein